MIVSQKMKNWIIAFLESFHLPDTGSGHKAFYMDCTIYNYQLNPK